MQQYRLEFFESYISTTTSTRRLRYVHSDFANNLTIDDDYIAIQTTMIDIGATNKVKAGQFIRVLKDNVDFFFGLVTDAEPGEYVTKVSFKPFLAIFDSNILFNIYTQYRSSSSSGLSLEETLQTYIDAYFVSNSDYRQDYPIDITISSSLTTKWNMNIQPETEGGSWATIGLYSVLIVRALKEYGVAISVTPNLSTGRIELSIRKIDGTLHLDADLDNVTVKTLKVNDRPSGINKLVVYNSLNYGMSLTYLVRSDRTWDRSDLVADEDRIVPVVYDIQTVTPDGTLTDPDDDFELAAIGAAYDMLNGLEWDNLIELEVAPNDPLINPMSIPIGKKIAVHYCGETYTSILTGKAVSYEVITLMFGSERISYTKKTSK